MRVFAPARLRPVRLYLSCAIHNGLFRSCTRLSSPQRSICCLRKRLASTPFTPRWRSTSEQSHSVFSPTHSRLSSSAAHPLTAEDVLCSYMFPLTRALRLLRRGVSYHRHRHKYDSTQALLDDCLPRSATGKHDNSDHGLRAEVGQAESSWYATDLSVRSACELHNTNAEETNCFSANRDFTDEEDADDNAELSAVRRFVHYHCHHVIVSYKSHRARWARDRAPNTESSVLQLARHCEAVGAVADHIFVASLLLRLTGLYGVGEKYVEKLIEVLFSASVCLSLTYTEQRQILPSSSSSLSRCTASPVSSARRGNSPFATSVAPHANSLHWGVVHFCEAVSLWELLHHTSTTLLPHSGSRLRQPLFHLVRAVSCMLLDCNMAYCSRSNWLTLRQLANAMSYHHVHTNFVTASAVCSNSNAVSHSTYVASKTRLSPSPHETQRKRRQRRRGGVGWERAVQAWFVGDGDGGRATSATSPRRNPSSCTEPNWMTTTHAQQRQLQLLPLLWLSVMCMILRTDGGGCAHGNASDRAGCDGGVAESSLSSVQEAYMKVDKRSNRHAPCSPAVHNHHSSNRTDEEAKSSPCTNRSASYRARLWEHGHYRDVNAARTDASDAAHSLIHVELPSHEIGDTTQSATDVQQQQHGASWSAARHACTKLVLLFAGEACGESMLCCLLDLCFAQARSEGSRFGETAALLCVMEQQGVQFARGTMRTRLALLSRAMSTHREAAASGLPMPLGTSSECVSLVGEDAAILPGDHDSSRDCVYGCYRGRGDATRERVCFAHRCSDSARHTGMHAPPHTARPSRPSFLPPPCCRSTPSACAAVCDIPICLAVTSIWGARDVACRDWDDAQWQKHTPSCCRDGMTRVCTNAGTLLQELLLRALLLQWDVCSTEKSLSCSAADHRRGRGSQDTWQHAHMTEMLLLPLLRAAHHLRALHRALWTAPKMMHKDQEEMSMTRQSPPHQQGIVTEQRRHSATIRAVVRVIARELSSVVLPRYGTSCRLHTPKRMGSCRARGEEGDGMKPAIGPVSARARATTTLSEHEELLVRAMHRVMLDVLLWRDADQRAGEDRGAALIWQDEGVLPPCYYEQLHAVLGTRNLPCE